MRKRRLMTPSNTPPTEIILVSTVSRMGAVEDTIRNLFFGGHEVLP